MRCQVFGPCNKPVLNFDQLRNLTPMNLCSILIHRLGDINLKLTIERLLDVKIKLSVSILTATYVNISRR